MGDMEDEGEGMDLEEGALKISASSKCRCRVSSTFINLIVLEPENITVSSPQ